MCQWKKTQRFPSICLPLIGLKKYLSLRTQQQICSTVLQACYSGWKRLLQAICKYTASEVPLSFQFHSAEKYFWHILPVSFVNQRMRCWKAHSTVKPLPSTRPNNLPDKSWAHSSGNQVKRAVCSRSPTFWSFSSLKSTHTALCGLVTECLLESGRQSCVKDVPGINTRWLFVFILASGFCYRMQQDGGFMKESLGETRREGFSCVYTDWGEPIMG